MKELTDIEKSYYAGLFDGEGSVRIEDNKKNRSYKLRVNFDLTYEPILREMKQYFYGSISKRDMEKRENSLSGKAHKAASANPEKHKQSYIYGLSGRDAWLFLKAIVLFCKEKKPQVDLAIIYYQGKRVGSTSLHEIERSEFYMAELQRMKTIESDDIPDNEIEEFEDDQQSLTCFFNEEK